MKISELKKGQKVTVRCKYKTLLVDMDAVVAGVRSEVVLLELIRHEGQVVDFSSPHVQIITIYEDGLDMPKAWTNCRIQKRTRQAVSCACSSKDKCKGKPPQGCPGCDEYAGQA